MLVETATWEAGRGWTPALPVPDHRSSLVLVFGPGLADDDADDAGVADDDPAAAALLTDAIDAVSTIWRDHALIGCSTLEPLGRDLGRGARLSVVVARFEHTVVRSCHIDVAQAGGARSAGRLLAETLSGPDLQGVFAVGDGDAISGTALAAGFAERLPGIPLAGGLAGDGVSVEHPWTIVDGRRRAGHVSAVAFSGRYVELGFGAAGGWDVFGPERLITQSYGNVLYELDGKPALPLYRDYLGDEADELPGAAVGYPMSVRDLEERTVIRTVWGVNPATESLRFADEVAQGSIAQLLRGSPERLIEGAHTAAASAAVGGEELAIAVSCVGRRAVLGDRCTDEVDAALEALDAGVRLVGFYSTSSLAPAVGGSDVHNQTMAITTIREHAAPRFDLLAELAPDLEPA